MMKESVQNQVAVFLLFACLLVSSLLATAQINETDSAGLQKLIVDNKIVQLSVAKCDNSFLIGLTAKKEVVLISKSTGSLSVEFFPSSVASVVGNDGSNFLVYNTTGFDILSHIGVNSFAFKGDIISKLDDGPERDNAGEYRVVKPDGHYRLNLATTVFTKGQADATRLLKREFNGADVYLTNDPTLKYKYGACPFENLYLVNFEGKNAYWGWRTSAAGQQELVYLPTAQGLQCAANIPITPLPVGSSIIAKDNTGSCIVNSPNSPFKTFVSPFTAPANITQEGEEIELTGNPFYYSGNNGNKNYLKVYNSAFPVGFDDVSFNNAIPNYANAEVQFTNLMDNYFLIKRTRLGAEKNTIVSVENKKLIKFDEFNGEVDVAKLSDSAFVMKNHGITWLFVFDRQKSAILKLYKEEIHIPEGGIQYLGQRHFAVVSGSKIHIYVYDFNGVGMNVTEVKPPRNSWFISALSARNKGDIWMVEIERLSVNGIRPETDIWFTKWDKDNYTPLQQMVTLQQQ